MDVVQAVGLTPNLRSDWLKIMVFFSSNKDVDLETCLGEIAVSCFPLHKHLIKMFSARC